jgi:hypothetical protein
MVAEGVTEIAVEGLRSRRLALTRDLPRSASRRLAAGGL